jgi:hypothetical protein
MNRGNGDLTLAAYSVDLAPRSPQDRDNLSSAYTPAPQALDEAPETYVAASFTLLQHSPINARAHSGTTPPWSTKEFFSYFT